jgi:hypothetical protein
MHRQLQPYEEEAEKKNGAYLVSAWECTLRTQGDMTSSLSQLLGNLEFPTKENL